ncbi:putative disease resistance protein RGA3 isoform X2 [Carex rostrata]
MGLGGVISNLLSLGAKLLPSVIASAQAASSSSSPAVDQNHQIEAELQKLMRILERIKATLYDAEQREITDLAVKLWLKELKGVVHDAEDVLGEYHYEVLHAQVEARNALPPDSCKRNLIQVPCGMLDQIQKIRGQFDEIAHDRIALQLTEGDGPKRCNSDLQIAPTSHMVVQSNIFGREREKEKLIDLLLSNCDVVSVVTIVGTGGIGKTILAQHVYNDKRFQQIFNKTGWICASEDFNVVRLTRESIQSITGNECGLTNLSALQEKFQEAISGKRVLFVLDDVWNENKSLWDSFQAPFMSAAFVKILVTTRNDHVARIMQTEPTFNLGYLSHEQCWQLFEHYAFGGKEHNKGQKLVEIGKQIMRKCGMLPLAVKSIASLLRYEGEEESWSDILESELWESQARNNIFPPLQISYVRLPTHLKSCFLYCSMFPKDYRYDVEYLVKLWMYQGFIESKGNKTKEKIGFQYAKQLCQRSLFERESRYEGNDFFGSNFKLHDIVHDLARYNSENGCYSIEVSKLPISPNVVNHLYIADNVNLIDPIPFDKFTALRTLITCSVKNLFSTFDHSMPPKLRALEIRGSGDCKLEFLSSIGILKHLRYLYISNMFFDTLPECICSLYNLQNLTLKHSAFKELPTKIQNLISLEEIIIDHSVNLAELPESLCQIKALRKLSLIDCRQLEELPSDIGSLTKLQTLEISNNGVSYLPPSLSKLVGIQALKVVLKCENIEWLKNFPDLRGTLYLCELNNVPNSMDLKCANLESMVNLEYLILAWDFSYIQHIDGSVFHLSIKSGENIIVDNQSCFSVMDSLRPHPNLIKLRIEDYSGITFPEWIGRLCKLKYLYITLCESLQFLKAESLPLQLEELKINACRQLISVPGIQKLKSLAKLSINYCENLCSFMDQSLDGGSSLGLTHLASLRILKISNCFKLQVLGDELLPVDCKIEVYNCPGLKEWCLQHRISYKMHEEEAF